MIGYHFSIQDNDSYAFRDRPAIREDTYWYEIHQTIAPNFSGAARTGVLRCANCGELLAKWDEPLSGLKLKKRRYDISITYDGVLVVSEAFKAIYDSNDLIGLRFRQLPDDPVFYAIDATAIVEFDSERRGTRFIKPCAACGRYESVVGATPVYLKAGSTIPDHGFVRTDLEFASEDEKNPLVLCGLTAGRILKNAKLKGVALRSI